MVNHSKPQIPGELSAPVLGLSCLKHVRVLNSLCLLLIADWGFFVLSAYKEIAGQPIQVRNISALVHFT